jgi:uncharacterized protein with beta-barrel porin domain
MVTLNHSSIISTGLGSTALTMSSGGNIYLENGGLIEGGATATAVKLIGGNDNLIVNDNSLDPNDTAIIKTSGTVFDTVITGTSGNDAIQNLNGASIIGSINLGSGVNSFLNGDGSYYLPGNTVNLGSGNVFTNKGYFSPGGLGTVMSASALDAAGNPITPNGITTLTGNFVQVDDVSGTNGHARLMTDLNFATSNANTDYTDFTHVTGTATLGGYLTLNSITGAAKPGTFSIPVLSAATIVDTGISIDPYFANGNSSSTVVFQPTLTVNTGDNTLYVNYDVNYDPKFLTPNGHNYARCVNYTQSVGVPGYQPVASTLFAIWEPVEYQKAVDSLTGEGTIASQQGIFNARANFIDGVLDHASSLIDCDSQSTAAGRQECEKKERSWIRFEQGEMNQTGNANVASSFTRNTGFSTGYERRISESAVVGVAAGFTHNDFNVSNRWTSGRTNGASVGLHGMLNSASGIYAKAMVMGGDLKTIIPAMLSVIM